MYQVIKYINDNIGTHLSLAQLARQCGYSKWYFCEMFRNFTGTTVVGYIRSRRMQLAAQDILAGQKAGQVAARYGYDTQAGFNKAFLKEFGCLPREYKHNTAASNAAYQQRRNAIMMHLSDRCALLREVAVHTRPLARHICAVREVLFVQGAADSYDAGQRDRARLLGAGLAHVIEKAPAYISDGELIVGYNYADNPYYDPWNVYGVQDTPEVRAQIADCGFTAAQADRFFAMRNILPNADASAAVPPPVELTQEDARLDEEWTSIGRCIANNHSVIGYDQVLRLGFVGLLQQVQAAALKNGMNSLYESMIDVCRAALQLGKNYAAVAENMAATEPDAARAAELREIAAVCRRVPAQPATTFREAVQSLWFAHIINTWEDHINANSIGRLDQMLWPYYQKDIAEGRLTRQQAFELICCLWLKLYRDYDVQQSCVGGCDADGNDAVNELSWLMLDATEELDFIRCMSVRFSSATDPAFLRRALEVVGHVQKGVPFFFNDDVMIPALVAGGIPLTDARSYTQIGCVETVIPGRSNPHAVTGETNLLKAVEYTFGNGHSMMHPGWALGVATGKPESFTDYKTFEEAVFAQIDYILQTTCRKVALWTRDSRGVAIKPYKSLLTDGCVQRGIDFNDHGALYDYYQIMLGGVPNLADSLLAVKKLVFDEKKLTMSQMYQALASDFEDEALRQICIHKVAKFGNDLDEVDDIAVRIIHRACDTLQVLSKQYGLDFHAQPFTFIWMIDHGRTTAATPDGRRAGEIIAYSVSPMQGRDFNGFTALLNSIAKLPSTRCPGTTSAIVEVDPKLFTDANLDRFVQILRAAASRGLANVQFNTIDADTLIAAQKNPEKYANLAVRVSGFSQKFNLLGKEMQDHIIGRTKHRCL